MATKILLKGKFQIFSELYVLFIGEYVLLSEVKMIFNKSRFQMLVQH
jgi:hypothetical protein